MRVKFFTVIIVLSVIFIGCDFSKKELTVKLNNPTSIERKNEIVEIPWDQVKEQLVLTDGQQIIVADAQGQQVPYQLTTNGNENPESLIFPVTVAANDSVTYRIAIGTPESFDPLVYGRLVPERKDDFAWENNRLAFRVYGPALKATGEISNGMDVWVKSTEELIIDKWYKNDLAGVASYHVDHGEGLDFYKVGRTLGLGMTAPVDNDTLCLGDNFVTAEILDNGPLRFTFKLTYDPYKAGNHEIKETRIISLDAYSYFNKVTNIFEADTNLLTVATGIVMEKDKPEITYGVNSGIIAYETPGDETNGTIYTAAIHPVGFGSIKIANDHYLGINSYTPGAPYIYYTGGGWSKAGFNGFDAWTEFVKSEKAKIDQPLQIQIQ